MTARLETPAEVAGLQTTLHDIADVLGVPVQAFTDHHGDEAQELLRLWCFLSREKQERLMEKAQELARGSASSA